MLKQFWEVKHLWGMPPKTLGGSTKFPGGHKVIHRTAQTAFVRVVTHRRVTLQRRIRHRSITVYAAKDRVTELS